MSAYATPVAFRRALTDRLKALAKSSRWELPQLQRQFAYDRLLERLYLMDDGWIVKGAVALLARDLGVRASIDIDVYRAKSADAAEADLREAAARDVGDWFRFEIGPRGTVADGAVGVRLPVSAYVGTTVWAQFHVDLVGSDLTMVGEPDAVSALAEVDMPDLSQRGYRAYPLIDHVADKIVATIQRYGTAQRPSTRFRDLVDLVAIVQGASVDAQEQIKALTSEAERRAIALPETFNVPDLALWESGYAAEAKRSLLATGHTLDEALAVVGPFIDPLLIGTARGTWDNQRGAWVEQ
jgi:Nucleotidyl transferase AbiEii toxin, Type IV TA system